MKHKQVVKEKMCVNVKTFCRQAVWLMLRLKQSSSHECKTVYPRFKHHYTLCFHSSHWLGLKICWQSLGVYWNWNATVDMFFVLLQEL